MHTINECAICFLLGFQPLVYLFSLIHPLSKVILCRDLVLSILVEIHPGSPSYVQHMHFSVVALACFSSIKVQSESHELVTA